MPNARVSDRTREGRTAAQTRPDSASRPVMSASWLHSGRGPEVARRTATGTARTAPKTAIHPARTMR